MTSGVDHDAIEPLFARETPLWLSVWAGTQAAALVVATLTAGLSVRVMVLVAVVIGYHVAGLLGRDWILHRTWAVLLYVPLGWAVIGGAISVHSAFSLLVFGAVIEAFVFLPFAWATAVLALVIVACCTLLIAQSRPVAAAALLIQLGAIVATGTTVGVVLLYINRANRDAAVRTDLLRRLDAARIELADRAHQAGALEERQRLSRDLHDTLAQTLASVIRHLEAVQLGLDSLAATGAAGDSGSALNG